MWDRLVHLQDNSIPQWISWSMGMYSTNYKNQYNYKQNYKTQQFFGGVYFLPTLFKCRVVCNISQYHVHTRILFKVTWIELFEFSSQFFWIYKLRLEQLQWDPGALKCIFGIDKRRAFSFFHDWACICNTNYRESFLASISMRCWYLTSSVYWQNMNRRKGRLSSCWSYLGIRNEFNEC